MPERAESSQMLSFSFPFFAGLAAWLAALVSPVLAVVKVAVAFLFGPELAEFVTRPYVFPSLCMLLAALVQGGVKIFLSYNDNQLRREREELLKQIAELEPHAPPDLRRK